MSIDEFITHELATEMRLLDDELDAGHMTQREYNEHIDLLHKWANEFYRAYLDGEV